jgi:protein involved in polysaccharide export with SLBB domain
MKTASLLQAGLTGLILSIAGQPRLATAQSAPAAPPASAAASVSLSGLNSGPRAPWQQRLTLGPGDVLNFGLFDSPELARTDIVIGPDGRVSYLQAEGIMAAGLTIDELRAKFDGELAKNYRNPRTLITPSAFHSKKYFVLGAVVSKGVFTLDRPLTVIEAIARAGGLETGMYDQKTVELADLPHSFLVRHGQRVPVDFERLFQRGDLSQNVPLEPDDYLYFASASANEIYVLGEVSNPGVLVFAPKPTALNAIAARGGFSPQAFKGRVLVVRGSLTHPETFVVDTTAILAGKTPDFKLQPKDIVYVSTNPWVVAAEVFDTAARAFVQSFVVEGATLRVPAAIK